MSESEYLLSNAEPETSVRFEGLEQTFDAVSIANLERIGVAVGARCLEVGAGGGSVARWLAGRVGASGRVLATDLDTRWFAHDGSPQLEVLELDLVGDPLPAGEWDLIHERLVLQHIPERLAILDRLVAALAPGGWILLEDFDTAEVRTTDREGPNHELIATMARAFNGLLRTRGGANEFAAGAVRQLRARGLVDIGARGYVAIDHGGEGFAKVMGANARQVREGLISMGVTVADIDRYLDVLADPETMVSSSVLISSWGRRPASE